jgi:hypothetical protein
LLQWAHRAWALNSAVECHLHTSPLSNTFNNLTRRPKLANRESHKRRWLYRVRTLPPTILDECIYRLLRGDPALRVAKWVMTRPHLGGMQGCCLETFRKYLEVLAQEVRKQQRAQLAQRQVVDQQELQATIEAENQKAIEQQRAENLKPPRPCSQRVTFEEAIGDSCARLDRIQALEALYYQTWDGLQDMLRAITSMYEQNVPAVVIAAMMPALNKMRVELTDRLIGIAAELRQIDSAAWAQLNSGS